MSDNQLELIFDYLIFTSKYCKFKNTDEQVKSSFKNMVKKINKDKILLCFKKIIEKDLSTPALSTDYYLKLGNIFNFYNVDLFSNGTWIFNKNAVESKERWKVYINPQYEYSIQLLYIIIPIFKKYNLSFKVINPRTDYKTAKCIYIAICPKICIYFMDNQNNLLYPAVNDLINIISKQYDINQLSFTPIKTEYGISNQPAFTRPINNLISYTQGGFKESGKNKLIELSNELKASDKIKNQYKILETTFTGINFYKYKYQPDAYMDLKLYDKYIHYIKEQKSTRNVFSRLVFTHNTNIDTFLNMTSGLFSFIRCCEISGDLVGKGAQFRYGLDSQYGDVKLIMKPNFWKKYKKGVKNYPYSEIVNYLTIFDFWESKDYKYPDDFNEIKKLMYEQSISYDFRERKNEKKNNGNDCTVMTYDEVKEFKQENRFINSWCNYQLHLAENVNFDDIDYVILPGYLQKLNISFEKYGKISDHLKMIQTTIIINGEVNPFYNKLFFNEHGNDSKSYYSYLSSRLTSPFYEKLQELKLISIIDEQENSVLEGTRRSSNYSGNSSMISNKLNIFWEDQKIYMKNLLDYGFYINSHSLDENE